MKLPRCRKLLQDADARITFSPIITYSPDPFLPPINGSSAILKKPFKPNTNFDSSMALTVLVLIAALFFLAFFSLYIRRLAENGSGGTDETPRRSHHHNVPPPLSSSRSHFLKGLDPSTVGSLPIVSYSGDAKHPIDCVICLSEFEERETVKLIPYCRHVFHPECIDTWLHSHVSCPLCRSTEMGEVDGVCLGGTQEDVDRGVSEMGRGSTVENGCREVGTLCVRRTCSCSSIGDRVSSLQRSTSF